MDHRFDELSVKTWHLRGMHLLPQRGDKPEWMHNQDYWAEKDEFPKIDLNDAAFVYK